MTVRTAPEYRFDGFHNLGSPYRRDLIEKAYTILGGIPQRQVMLDNWFSGLNKKQTPTCGTIACGLGWLTLHPEFKELGLKVGRDFGQLTPFLGNSSLNGFALAGKVFTHLTTQPAPQDGWTWSRLGHLLFAGAGHGELDECPEFYNHYGFRQEAVLGFWRKEVHRDLLLARLHYVYHHHSI